MIEKISTLTSVQFTSSSCTEIISLHISKLQKRDSLRSIRKKKYEIEEMPTARVTRPQATATSAVPPHAQPAPIETFGERARRLFNKRDATSASNENTAMVVAVRPAIRELPPQPDSFINAVIYIKLKTTQEVIFVLGWGEFIQQYQFNELDDIMSKLEKGQNITKTAEETAVELDGEMSMDAELIGKFITQQVAVAMAEKKKQYEEKIKN